MSPKPLTLSELDKRLAKVMPLVLKLAKPLESLFRILLTWSKFPLDELKGELRPPEVEKRSLSPLLPVWTPWPLLPLVALSFRLKYIPPGPALSDDPELD